jgi:excisionase family DNA binding protein
MSTKTLSNPIAAGADLLDEAQAAEILTVAKGTLGVWRSTGRYGLPFVKVGRRVRYRRSDLLAWLEKRTRETGATA